LSAGAALNTSLAKISVAAKQKALAEMRITPNAIQKKLVSSLGP